MIRRFLRYLMALSLTGLLLTTGAAVAAETHAQAPPTPPPTLSGEDFGRPVYSNVTTNCTATAETVTFQVDGVAFPPVYPGTFTEWVRVTDSGPGTPATFTAVFRVVSPAGTIYGFKSGPAFPLICTTSPNFKVQISAQRIPYRAVIQPPGSGSTWCDSGDSNAGFVIEPAHGLKYMFENFTSGQATTTPC